MAEQKFTVPTEQIDLPSQGKIYDKASPLSSGKIEMKYMTAKEEDILTNVNLLRQGVAIERMLKSLIKSDVPYEDLIIGDRNGLLIAARILAYGKDYTFKYKNPSNNDEEETITIDLQDLKYKTVDFSKFTGKNEFEFTLPYSKNVVTFKLLTVGDDKKIDEEIKGMKKMVGQDAGLVTTRLKHQIISINGEYSVKTVRDFIDQGYLLSRDAIELRKFIATVNPDVDMTINFTTKDGQEVEMDLPMTVDFFFPGSGV
jgi:hypothetical protein